MRLGPLGKRDFALFFAGQSLSVAGSAMVPVALSFAILEQHGTAAQVSAVLAAETVPLVLLLLIGGAIADRLPRRHVMIGADLLRFGAEATLAMLLLPGHAPLLAIMALAALLGAGHAFFVPGRTGLIPQIVHPAHLQAANSLVAIARSAGDTVGPAIGGILVGTLGAGWAVGFDAGSYGLSALCLLLIRAPAERVIAQTSVARQLVVGWHHFRSRLWLWLTVAQFTLFHMITWGPLTVLGALRFSRVPHGPELWGALLGTLGAGAIAGGLAAIRLRPKFPLRAAQGGFVLSALITASMAYPAPLALQFAAFFAGGFGLTLFNVLWDTTMQRQIPPHLISQLSAYDMVGSIGLLPVGYMLAAPMAAAFGINGTFWIATACTMVSACVVVLQHEVRTMRT